MENMVACHTQWRGLHRNPDIPSGRWQVVTTVTIASRDGPTRIREIGGKAGMTVTSSRADASRYRPHMPDQGRDQPSSRIVPPEAEGYVAGLLGLRDKQTFWCRLPAIQNNSHCRCQSGSRCT